MTKKRMLRAILAHALAPGALGLLLGSAGATDATDNAKMNSAVASDANRARQDAKDAKRPHAARATSVLDVTVQFVDSTDDSVTAFKKVHVVLDSGSPTALSASGVARARLGDGPDHKVAVVLEKAVCNVPIDKAMVASGKATILVSLKDTSCKVQK